MGVGGLPDEYDEALAGLHGCHAGLSYIEMVREGPAGGISQPLRMSCVRCAFVHHSEAMLFVRCCAG